MADSSSRQRPPGRGRIKAGAPSTKSLLTWTLLAAFFTTSIHAKIDHVRPVHAYRSTTTQVSSPSQEARSQPGRSPPEVHILLDTPTAKFRNTDENSNILRYQDALAPAHVDSAVRAPPAQSTESPRLSALTPARLLQDWEAEDIILLSTIDGALHARDRKTGQHRWTLEMPDNPMIEAIHHPQNRSEFDESIVQPEYIFIVEPSKDGQLYAQFMNPQIGLVRLQTTVRQMATEVPLTIRVNGQFLAISSETQTKPYTIDAATGEILFESRKNRPSGKLDTQPRCRRRNDLEVEDPACMPGQTIRLGRSFYTFTISDEDTAQDLCTIKFSEWVTLKNNNDLQQQYGRSLDGTDIQSLYNGRIIGLDMNSDGDLIHRYNQMLDAPVAKVFDVVRSIDDLEESTELALLSRPMDLPLTAQAKTWRDEMKNSHRVFVDKSSNGHWYAMSELSYPGVTTGAPMAGIAWNRNGQLLDPEGDLHEIVGVHVLSQDLQVEQVQAPMSLLISGTPANDNSAIDEGRQIAPVDEAKTPSIIPSPGTFDWLSIVIAMFASWVVFFFFSRRGNMLIQRIAMAVLDKQPTSPRSMAVETVTVVQPVPDPTPDQVTDNPGNLDLSGVLTQVSDTEVLTQVHSRGQSNVSAISGSPKKTKGSDQDESGSDEDSDGDEVLQEETKNNDQGPAPKTKKGKTKRGKRGGVKNKKKMMDPTTFDKKPILAVEQHLDNGMVQVGRLKIDTREENCLGRGSNGTTVYPGSFEGREVAVKRLIKSTNDLAKKEIQHLMSSDENSHIIRYVSKEESRDFFYIALDKYTTSLDQFIEHPERFPALVSETQGFDVKDCLRQITDGVKHLHSLKLVHRDIKPQNVLVKAVKSGRPNQGLPKLHFVISDFGLCKPLDEGAMSTFAPTANHTAAGTTGWRAPELLVDRRDCVAAPTADSTQSTHSTIHSSSSPGDGTVLDRPSGRRATKAIDIFSLGCVFYYVMSQGGHPFDKGGSSLGRDLNIKENNLTTELLRLHNYEFDADDLILQMLKHDPKERPDCGAVLRHPYFWSAEQKLEFVCLVSDSYEREKSSIKNIHDETLLRSAEEQWSLAELAALEAIGPNVIGTRQDGTIRDWLHALPKSFINEMGKQRKYTGTRMIDLLRAIRNKKNHRHDLPTEVKELILGRFPDTRSWECAYYQFWAGKFPSLLVNVHCLLIERNLVERFEMGRWYE